MEEIKTHSSELLDQPVAWDIERVLEALCLNVLGKDNKNNID